MIKRIEPKLNPPDPPPLPPFSTKLNNIIFKAKREHLEALRTLTTVQATTRMCENQVLLVIIP